MISEYNTYMGGCDLSDMLASFYRVEHKCVKWYKRIFLWALNVAIINGWLLYRRHWDQREENEAKFLPLCYFTAEITESLCLKCKVPPQLMSARERPLNHVDIFPESTIY